MAVPGCAHRRLRLAAGAAFLLAAVLGLWWGWREGALGTPRRSAAGAQGGGLPWLLPGTDWRDVRVPTDIRTSYDPVCDPGTSAFHVNNTEELKRAPNFSISPVNTVGFLDASLKAAQVALAWYTAPALPLPTANTWRPRDPYFAERLDPKLGQAGPALAVVVLPPSISAVTATYMGVKMKDRATIAGIGMPWSVNFQVFIFFAQVVQGLIATWIAFLAGPNNFVWLLRNFNLTFRFEVWGQGLFHVLRLLLTFKAVQRFIGINVVSTQVSNDLRDTFKFHAYPWRVEGQSDTRDRIELLIWLLDIFSKRVILPTAAVVAFLFLPSFAVNLVPGAAMGAGALYLFNRRRRRNQGPLRDSLLQAESSELHVAGHQNVLPRLENTREVLFVFACSVFCGNLISLLIKCLLSADTYLCPYAKMTVLSFDVLSDMDSIAVYASTILLLSFVAFTAAYVAAVMVAFMKENRDEKGPTSEVGWLVTLVHGLWVARCSRELELTDEKHLFQALPFAAISGWEFDRVPCPATEDRHDLIDWTAQFQNDYFPADYVKKWGSPMVGAGKCLRKAGCSAKQLRELKRNHSGFSPGQLKEVGYSISELNDAGFDTVQLKAVGCSASELRQVGHRVDQLQEAGYSATQLKDAGYSASQLKEVGFSALALSEAHYAAKELEEAGFDEDQITPAMVQEDLPHEWMAEKAAQLIKAGFDMKTLRPMLERAFNVMMSSGGGISQQPRFPSVPSSLETEPPVTAAPTDTRPAEAPSAEASSSANPSVEIPLPNDGPSSTPSDTASAATGQQMEAPQMAVPAPSPQASRAEALPTEATSTEESEFQIGAMVELHGMKNAEFNGKVGKVLAKANDRWTVQLPDRTASIKAINLKEVEVQSELEVGDLVELHSMKSAAFNGKVGKIVAKDSDRWSVQLPDRTARIKSSNLRRLDRAGATFGSPDSPPSASAAEQEFRRERGRRGRCMIHHTPVGAGVAQCQGGDNLECLWCSKFFCRYHYPVNNDDGVFSFAGHVCPTAPFDANVRSGAGDGTSGRRSDCKQQ
mmetsp:Transcript_11651/g.32886  ORF Transcript_11651/g.32886 Transcript_11651/m.32886 type:complete len:1042 (+) Transcript_11651:78-3203(+)